MTFEEKVKESHEARVRLLTKYGNFVEVERIVKVYEDKMQPTCREDKGYIKSYSLNQFDLFKPY